MTIRFDHSQRPLVRVTFSGNSSDADWDAYHAELTAVLTQAQRTHVKVGLLVDGRLSEIPTASQRRKAADMEHLLPLMAASLVGMSMCLATPIQRGVLTAIFWIRPLPVPHKVVAVPEEGETWLRELLRAQVAA